MPSRRSPARLAPAGPTQAASETAGIVDAHARGRRVTTHRILPLPGYTPTIGRLVAMLTYARQTTLAAVNGLTRDQLDHLHDEKVLTDPMSPG